MSTTYASVYAPTPSPSESPGFCSWTLARTFASGRAGWLDRTHHIRPVPSWLEYPGTLRRRRIAIACFVSHPIPVRRSRILSVGRLGTCGDPRFRQADVSGEWGRCTWCSPNRSLQAELALQIDSTLCRPSQIAVTRLRCIPSGCKCVFVVQHTPCMPRLDNS